MFYCLLLWVLCVSSVRILEAAIPEAERNALIALYQATDGGHWRVSTNWMGATGTEDTWYGVKITEGHVIDLDLSSNNLTGSLPAEIGDLAKLANLRLEENSLTGNIPGN